jgi:hypothetical protein
MIEQTETTEVHAKLNWIEPRVAVVEARDAEDGIAASADGTNTAS